MIAPKRRALLAAAGIGALGIWAAKPRANGAPHTPYFADLTQALKRAGIATPTLVIDRAQLLRNAAQVMANVKGRMDVRLVVKSLPCQALIDAVAAVTHSRKMMLFSLPQLNLMAKGDNDILLGKPMPVVAAASYYQHASAGKDGFTAERQLQWLIDTPERLAQYRDLARQQALNLRINLEIDVGLHRGGIPDLDTLHRMLAILQSEPHLQWSGMMGYDAHVAKIPDLPGLRTAALTHARDVYARFAAATQSVLKSPNLKPTFNVAGSPTYRLYDGSGIENELSIGSAMVKASDFDLASLDDLKPAVFIATPVLKVMEKFSMPYGVEAIGTAARIWDPNQRKAVFIYGGNWLADPVSPSGLRASGLYGTSSNQQLLTASGAQQLQPDDIVFFRPRQSEAVLQQFGDIAVYENGKIAESWPVLPATG